MGENNPQTIEFHINRDDAKHRPDSEKINILLDLGFDSNERMVNVERTLHGTGQAGDKPGLCETVSCHAEKLTTMWRMVMLLLGIIGAAAVGVIFSVMKP